VQVERTQAMPEECSKQLRHQHTRHGSGSGGDGHHDRQTHSEGPQKGNALIMHYWHSFCTPFSNIVIT